ncbi:MAG TPA: (deoxy)nucleoside triphosphate pyrophosphohydrolase [Candidatus Borkfalkia avistercoris]|uniref:8-oxo-dGTP diphosphatase n=1 Tax=Candidatus Borkfalkia avistercoris TaxID=2838504 RepID=A0A9D2D069_9FIRM|nr:(deoxy)nucleoside triphosphate pyrophosphohydrolase [Candidatus Borkfalkia avistercoris]
MEMKKLHVVGAAIVEDGRVLAAKRGESKYGYVAHKYEFVGGKVEEGESETEALVREVREELGAEIEVTGLLIRVGHTYPDFEIELSVYFSKLLSGYRMIEHESLRWIPVAGLKAEEWAPADAPAVEKLKTMA